MIFDEDGFVRTLWYGRSRIWQKARKYRDFGGFKRNHLWLTVDDNILTQKKSDKIGLFLRLKLPFMERETRFELATFALARQRSTTEPFPHSGGNNRARTYDPLLVRQMLSQLSYASER